MQEYIGETGDTLRLRITVLKQQISSPNTRMSSVSRHVDMCAYNWDIQFKIFPLYMYKNENRKRSSTKNQRVIFHQFVQANAQSSTLTFNKVTQCLNVCSLRYF